MCPGLSHLPPLCPDLARSGGDYLTARFFATEPVILPKPGRKSETRRQHERQHWFWRGRRFHAGVEGRISVIKRKHGLDRCRNRGQDGFDRWVGWGVIANNLIAMGKGLSP